MYVKCDNVTYIRHLTCNLSNSMRKNGSRLISVQQYKATDLFLFAVILLVAELISHFARQAFPADTGFSLMVPVVLIVMMRWGWPGIIYAVADGLVVCLFAYKTATPYQYAAYIIGNAFIAVMYIVLRLVGKDKVRKKAWTAVLFALGGWLCVYLGRSLVWLTAVAAFPAEGLSMWGGFISFGLGDALSLVMAVVVVLILRRFDGMFEDQIEFLCRLKKQREDKRHAALYGDELEEIDQEALRLFKQNDDLY